jgi:hypothetical protein
MFHSRPKYQVSSTRLTGDQGGRKRIGRRPLLKGLGTTGLATSAAVFVGTATATKASAEPLCCHLANYPENTSYSYCSSHAAYIWYCRAGDGINCNCCETAGNAQSASYCYHP